MNRNKGILFAAAGALIWSSGGVFIKLIDAPGIYISAARSLVASLVFLPFLKPKSIKWSLDLFFLVLCYAYTMIGFVIATKMTTAANAIVLQYTAPIWLFVFYSLAERRFNKRKLLPVALVLSGILFFLFEPASGTSITGNLLALSTGISFAGVAHFSAKDHGVSGPGLISICNFAAFLIALPFVRNIAATTVSLDLLSIIGIIVLGTFQIALGYLFYMRALKNISPLDTALICLLEPLMNPIWVLIFVGEVPSSYALAGSFLVLLGIIANIFKDRKRSAVARN